MKLLFILPGLLLFISCSGQDGSKINKGPDSVRMHLKLITPEVQMPTSIDYIPVEKNILSIKIFADGHIAYQVDNDTSFTTIPKDQLLATVDRYPDKRIAIIGGKNTTYDKVKEVMELIRKRNSSFYIRNE